MVNNKEELIDLLIDRDGISYAEAANLVDAVQDEVYYLIDGAGTYSDIEDLLASELGLEPDYMELFLD